MPRFSETLLDHARDPRNGHVLDNADAVGRANLRGGAPRVAIYLKVTGDVINKASFQAFGCGVTVATCSAVTELAAGQTVKSCRDISADQVVEALDGIPADKRFCAHLVVAALRNALDQLQDETNTP